MPRWLVVTIVVAVVLLAIAAIAAAPFLTATADKEATLFIKHGTSNDAVGEMIAAEVSSDFSSKVMELLTLTGGDLSTRQGAFKIKEGESALSVANHLRRGSPDEVKVTINNIRTKEQLAKLLGKKLMMDEADFLKALNDKELCSSLEKNPDNVTGLFLADTYQFLWDDRDEIGHSCSSYINFFNASVSLMLSSWLRMAIRIYCLFGLRPVLPLQSRVKMLCCFSMRTTISLAVYGGSTSHRK